MQGPDLPGHLVQGPLTPGPPKTHQRPQHIPQRPPHYSQTQMPMTNVGVASIKPSCQVRDPQTCSTCIYTTTDTGALHPLGPCLPEGARASGQPPPCSPTLSLVITSPDIAALANLVQLDLLKEGRHWACKMAQWRGGACGQA